MSLGDIKFTIQTSMPVGYWSFQNDYIKMYLLKKPRWLTRISAKIFFQLTWVDLPDTE